MSENSKAAIDLGLKIVATLIAIFGIWKYFADREAAEVAATKAKSIEFIDLYASRELQSARESLVNFWQSNREFVIYIKSNRITPRAYRNFVESTYPHYTDYVKIQNALLSIGNLFDQIYFCRESKICDSLIINAYFCPIASKYEAIYGPFYEIIREGVGSIDFGRSLSAYADSCRD